MPSDKTFGPETVTRVADLARLQLTPEETNRFAAQLASVLAYIEKLNELDTTQVEPLTHPLELDTPLRPDVARPSPGAAAMLESAPEHLYDSFKVPQVMGGGH
jgi:aspartyl-tRNA(Asn)/glutamyl-tRNA(Gln) amidotransferase subunit C